MKTSPRIQRGPAGSGMSMPIMARMHSLSLPALMIYSSPSSVYSWPSEGMKQVGRRGVKGCGGVDEKEARQQHIWG